MSSIKTRRIHTEIPPTQSLTEMKVKRKLDDDDERRNEESSEEFIDEESTNTTNTKTKFTKIEEPKMKKPKIIKESFLNSKLTKEKDLKLVSEKLSLDDLISSIDEEVISKTPDTQQLGKNISELSKISRETKSGKLFHNVEEVTLKRLESREAYDKVVDEEMSKWGPIVKFLEETQTVPLTFEDSGIEEKISKRMKLKNKSKLDELLIEENEKNGFMKFENIPEGKILSKEELIKRSREIALRRRLMDYQSKKLQRIKNIKSKAFRRRLKKQKHKIEEQLNAALTEEEILKREKELIKERITLRHKNSSKWMRNAMKKSHHHEGYKSAISDHMQLLRELKKRQTKEEEEDEEEIIDKLLNDSESGIEELKSSVKPAPSIKGGLFSLKFMKKSEEKKIQQQLELIEEIERDIKNIKNEEEEEMIGRRRFDGKTKEEFEEGKEFDNQQDFQSLKNAKIIADGPKVIIENEEETEIKEMNDDEEVNEKEEEINEEEEEINEEEVNEEEINKKNEEKTKVNEKLNNEVTVKIYESSNEISHSMNQTPIPNEILQSKETSKETKETSKSKKRSREIIRRNEENFAEIEAMNPWLQSSSETYKEGRSSKKQKREEELDINVSLNEDEEEQKPKEDEFNQKIKEMAFAGDDVQMEFDIAKEKAIDEEIDLPDLESAKKPGWGTWAGKGTNYEEELKRKSKKIESIKKEIREQKKEERFDKDLGHVIIRETAKAPTKYLAKPKLLKTEIEQKIYDNSMSHPLGPEWNTFKGHEQLTNQRVELIPGKIIKPMTFEEGVALLNRKNYKKMKKKDEKDDDEKEDRLALANELETANEMRERRMKNRQKRDLERIKSRLKSMEEE